MGNLSCSSKNNQPNRRHRQRKYTRKYVKDWNVDDVYDWLLSINEGELSFTAEIFKKHKINGNKLMSLNDNQLTKMGISLKHQEKIKSCMQKRLEEEKEEFNKSTDATIIINPRSMNSISTLDTNRNNMQKQSLSPNILLEKNPNDGVCVDTPTTNIDGVDTPTPLKLDNNAADTSFDIPLNDIINDILLDPDVNLDVLCEIVDIVSNYPFYNQLNDNNDHNTSYNCSNGNQNNNKGNSNNNNNNNNNNNSHNNNDEPNGNDSGNGSGNSNGNSGDKNGDKDGDRDKDKNNKNDKDKNDENDEEKKEEKDEKDEKDEEQKLNINAPVFNPYKLDTIHEKDEDEEPQLQSPQKLLKKMKKLSKTLTNKNGKIENIHMNTIPEEHQLQSPQKPLSPQKVVQLKYSYDPNRDCRANGRIKISRTLTNKNGKIANMIAENIKSLNFYIDKSTAMQEWEQIKLKNGKIIKIMNFDFHHKHTNENLYCIVENIQNDNNVIWEMNHKLLTAKQIKQMYKISSANIPQSTRMSIKFQKQLNGKDKIMNILMNEQKMNEIIKNTKWTNIPVKTKKNNKKRVTLSLNKQEFIKNLCGLNNRNNIHLIPIVMFNNLNNKCEYRIEYVWIIKIDKDTNIGISFKYNEQTLVNNITVSGIHLCKEYIMHQCQVVSDNPYDMDYLDDIFESDITHLKIGDPDAYKNAIKSLRQRLEERNAIFEEKEAKLKKKNVDLNKENVDLKKKNVDLNEKLRQTNQRLQSMIKYFNYNQSFCNNNVNGIHNIRYSNSSQMQLQQPVQYNMQFPMMNNTKHRPRNAHK